MRSLALLPVALCLLMAGCGYEASPEAASTAQGSEIAPDPVPAFGAIHTIALPQFPPELPGGPSQDTFTTACSACHSLRYITMQPRFARAAWEASVQKMIKVYGAKITPDQAAQIVDYLAATSGAQKAAGQP